MKKSFIIYLFLTLSVVLYAQQHSHIRCNYRKCWESPIKLKTSVSPVLRY